MKFFLLLALFLTSNSFASFISGRMVHDTNLVVYTLQSDCEFVESDSCYRLPEGAEIGTLKFKSVHSEISKNEESCLGESCLILLSEKVCSVNHSAFINEDYTAVYCREIIGKELIIDPILKAQKDAEEISKQQFEASMAQAEKAMNCGKSAQKLLLVRNSSKGLTTAQIKQMVSIYAPIKELLDTGSLVSAAEEIAEVEADGTLVTADDKTALMDHLSECMAQ